MRKLLCSTLLLTALAVTSAASAQTAPYTRTVIVPANASTTANGAALLAALASLTPSPSYANRWLIKLEPGIYNVGSTPVVMREYVDIEGSGIIESHIQGAVDPTPSLMGGLVRGASNSEIRSLTISCVSDATTTGCQALSVENATPRLTQMRILVQGTGTGTHWGMRTFNGGPILNNVEVTVTPGATAYTSYGIVYTGQSTLSIYRSSIHARNATSDNVAIVIKDDLLWSPMRDSSVTASGGSRAMGIAYLESSTANPLILDNVIVAAQGASGVSIGIGLHPGSLYKPRSTIYFQGGRILGSTDGVNFELAEVTVELKHTEVEAWRYIAQARHARLYFVRAKGTGTVEGLVSEQCAAIVNSAGIFLPSTCP